MRRQHWEKVYQKHPADTVTWHQDVPALSLRLMDSAGLEPTTRVIDIGAGDSRLVDVLVNRRLEHITVLDVSGAALARARARLGAAAAHVKWVEADVTGADWHVDPVDIWHDRAVFHFLTDPADRERYIERASSTIVPGGALIMGTFALDGPSQCSGLPVCRYSAETLAATLGPSFTLLEQVHEMHHTPAGVPQSFQWCRFRHGAKHRY
jgi:cyclopropane fatty-acyl-phospholipid synthase-like methyltransferase